MAGTSCPSSPLASPCSQSLPSSPSSAPSCSSSASMSLPMCPSLASPSSGGSSRNVLNNGNNSSSNSSGGGGSILKRPIVLFCLLPLGVIVALCPSIVFGVEDFMQKTEGEEGVVVRGISAPRRNQQTPGAAAGAPGGGMMGMHQHQQHQQHQPPPAPPGVTNHAPFSNPAAAQPPPPEEPEEEEDAPFPIIEKLEDDDKIPTIEEPEPALECRASVMEFVINASDRKDECDGLRRAFEAACTDSTRTEQIFGADADTVVRPSGLGDGTVTVEKMASADVSEGLLKDKETVAGAGGGPDNDAYDLPQDVEGDASQEVELDQEQVETMPENLVVEHVQHDDDEEDDDEGYASGGGQRLVEQQNQPQTLQAHHVEPVHQHHQHNRHHRYQKAQEEGVVRGHLHQRWDEEGERKNRERDIRAQSGPEGTRNLSVNSPSLPTKLGQDKKLSSAILFQGAAPSNNHNHKFNPMQKNKQNKHKKAIIHQAQSILESPESIEATTCCSSILNVFHEHCDQTNEEMEYTDRRLIVIISVIALCGMVKSLIRHFRMYWLPEAAGCILVGVILGAILDTMPNIKFSFDGSLFLRVMLPPIVFHAALSIDKRSLYQYLFPIMVYACAGTLLSAGLVATLVYCGTLVGVANIPLVESFIFGALICSIDPIAILSVLQSIGLTDTDAIYVIVFGESLFNDGVAIVLYETLISFLDDSTMAAADGSDVGFAILHFTLVLVGSAVIGAASGAACTVYFAFMKGCHTPLVEVLMFICWALIPYYICDGVAWSGIVAIVAMGVVMDLYVVGQNNAEEGGGGGGSHGSGIVVGNVGGGAGKSLEEGNSSGGSSGGSSSPSWVNEVFSKRGHLSSVARNHVHFVSEINATLMETSIFAYLGIFLLSSRYKWSVYLSVLAVASCLVSRAIMIPVLSYLVNWWGGRGSSRSARAMSRMCGRRENVQNSYSNSSGGVLVDQRMQIVLWFGGLRGAMSFALVENIPLYDAATGFGSRYKPELKAMTSASIIFTVFLCGGTTYYMLQRLGMFVRKDSEVMEGATPLVALGGVGSPGSSNGGAAKRKLSPNGFRSEVGNAGLDDGTSMPFPQATDNSTREQVFARHRAGGSI